MNINSTGTMKQARYILLSLAALIGFAACSSDSDLAPSRPEGNAVVVRAAVGKAGVFTRTTPNGDEAQQAKFNPGDEIALTDGTKTVNYTLADDGTTWNPSTPGEYLVWGNGTMNFKAYYPVGNSNSFDNGGVETDQSNQSNQSNIAKSDYMTATTTATKPDNHTLDLKFERQTARVVVNIKGYNTQFSELNPRITRCYIYGAIDASQNVQRITPLKVKDDSKNPEYMALVYPGDAKPGENFLRINVNHDDDGFKTTGQFLYLKGIPALEAGKSYTYNVTVGKDRLTVESVTVNDWDEENPNKLGEGEADQLRNIGPGLPAAYVGKVVASDGSIYPTKAEAEADGKKAVAMIAYVGNDTGDGTYKNGLAIALDYVETTAGSGDNESKNFGTNNLPAPTNSSNWKAPTVNNLKHIFASFEGGTPYTSRTLYMQKCSMGDFQDKLKACGGNVITNNIFYVYTSDQYTGPGTSTYLRYWAYRRDNVSAWVYCTTISAVNVRPVFAF